MRSQGITVQIPSNFQGLVHSKALHIRERNLPHWSQDGASYFITFRLADSIPLAAFHEIEREASFWRTRAEREERNSGGTLPKAFMDEWEAFQRRQLIKLETTMDAGHGSCVLGESANRNIVAETLLFFNKQRYALHAFVIMPNHVHMSVTPHPGWELGKLLQSWKGFTSRQINKRLGRQGTLWQHDSFDRIIRHEEHFVKVVRYIAANPIKANLAQGSYTLWLGDCVEPTDTGVSVVREDISEYGEDLDVW
jgi:menaquinone-specific isochorismate synthase/putative DNA methylase